MIRDKVEVWLSVLLDAVLDWLHPVLKDKKKGLWFDSAKTS